LGAGRDPTTASFRSLLENMAFVTTIPIIQPTTQPKNRSALPTSRINSLSDISTIQPNPEPARAEPSGTASSEPKFRLGLAAFSNTSSFARDATATPHRF
jgi:hypothetical protein